ncbi:MAG: DegV family protein [Candidatus Ventricola sp.]
MTFRIAADSSSNIRQLEGVSYQSVPLKIITRDKEYVDDPQLDVAGMVEALRTYKGTSSTSCPNVYDWLEAFGDADAIFAITITSSLSGSCNAARQAAQEYMKQHPDRRVCVIDTLSTGPEMRLLAERIRAGIQAGRSFEEIEADARGYLAHTHLLFMLQSLNNLARNGRVSPAAAKIAGVLGICVVGKASDEGTLQQMHKCRGEKRALDAMLSEMNKHGYAGGRVCISHCLNEAAARQLEAAIRAEHPHARVDIEPCGALCSFYAERGGLIVGFEEGEGK